MSASSSTLMNGRSLTEQTPPGQIVVAYVPGECVRELVDEVSRGEPAEDRSVVIGQATVGVDAEFPRAGPSASSFAGASDLTGE